MNYIPTNEFVAKHRLHVDEAEDFVMLLDHEQERESKKSIVFSKETGMIALGKLDELGEAKTLFYGAVPDEAALDAVLDYTSFWSQEPAA